MIIKICAKCKQSKAIDEFRSITKKGKPTKSSYCKDCTRIISYESYQKLRRVKYPKVIDMLGEEWRKIPINGLENYEVSSFGRIKTLGHYTVKKNGHVCFHQERLLTQTKLLGYYQVSCFCNGTAKTFRVSRLVATAFHPNPENKPEVNHIDGNKKNNFASNLEWNTKSENNIHARENKLIIEKLSKEQVLAIFNSEGNAKEIGKKYGVSDNTVYEIKSGKTRSRITGKQYVMNKDDAKFTNKRFL